MKELESREVTLVSGGVDRVYEAGQYAAKTVQAVGAVLGLVAGYMALAA